MANEETLPNGIQVRRETIFSGGWSDGDDEIEPWIASINIGPWHYSERGKNKEYAIKKLFQYMKHLKVDFEDQLKRDTERLHTLNKFLETENGL